MKNTLVTSLFIFGSLLLACQSDAQIITTVAGNTQAGYSGDGMAATATKLNAPCGVAVDKKGNIYIADQNNYRVRKVDTSGIISTFAGIGIQRYSGDGGPATAAELALPVSIAIDFKGNVYIDDEYNDMIRMVDTNGIIWRFAGRGYAGFLGNGSLATGAELNNPCGVTVDDTGNVYIADTYNNQIRKVNTSGIISAFAGNGYGYNIPSGGFSGDGGQAADAELYGPTDVAVDAEGKVFITDCTNQRVRMVDTNGIITTIAGDSAYGFYGDGGTATAAEFYYPYGITISSNNIYVVDHSNERIRMFNTGGIISTIAGNGISGYFGDGGEATAAEFHLPTKISIDVLNNIYIADQDNNVIRKIAHDTNIATGITKTEAGDGNLDVFPNPNGGTFTLPLSNVNEKCHLEIFNILGEEIYQAKTNSNNIEINLSGQSNGIYLYRVLRESGEFVGNGKVIIEK